MRVPLALMSTFLACAAMANHAIMRTLDPALSPDGKQIAFSWQGDIWVAPSSGGDAKRLTVHPAVDEAPLWSPDGQFIYFSSGRFGTSNLFRMKPDGSELTRLTFESAPTYATSVSPDGKTIYGYTTAYGRSNVFRTSTNGGELVRLTYHPLETQFSPEVSPDGKSVIFCEGGSAGQWRKPGQHGSNTPELWMGKAGAPLTDLKRMTTNEFLDMYPRFLDENHVLEMSNRSGAHNLWILGLDGKPERQVTHFDGGTIRAITVSRDGKFAAYQRNSRTWTTNLTTGESKPVDFFVPDDTRRVAIQDLNLTTGASHIALSPNGKRAMLDLRGDIFVLPASGGTTKQLTTNPNWDGQEEWLDDKRAVYVGAGDNGKRALFTIGTDGTSKVFYESSLDLLHPVPSPDRKFVAFQRGEHEIVVMPVAGGTPIVVATGRFLDAFSGPRTFNWSPDGKWLAVTSENDRNGFDVSLVKADGTPVSTLTRGRTAVDSTSILIARVGKSAGAPWFYPNSKGLFFVGQEGLDFNEDRDSQQSLYAVDFAPDSVTYAEDDLDKIDDAPKKDESAPQVNIVYPGLKERKKKLLTQVDNAWPGADGNTIYAQTAAGLVKLGGPAWKSTPVGTFHAEELVATKGKITYISQGKVYSLVEKSEAPTPVNFSAHMSIDVHREDMALFNEAWWALDRMFYDAKHHGKNWEAIRQEFSTYVPEVTSRDDFYSLMGEMVERLDSSHQGANTSEPPRTDTPQPTGWLGVDFALDRLDAGKYVVSHVYASGPAALPDSQLLLGDQIGAVNGVKLDLSHLLSEALINQAGHKVVLDVVRNSVPVKVTIKPAAPTAKTPAYYQDWVERNRGEVDRLSGGQLAYMHIAAMDTPSLERFLIDIQNETIGKKGVIVDVRFNGGGFTSHIILNIMRKNTWLKRTFRDNQGSWISENIMRGNSLELPAACLTNQFSFSNAEIFSEGFRRLGLGPVIGEPTAGGVIGTGAYGLWDGGSVRMPGIGVFAVDGENLEGHGRKPTKYVAYDPVAWMNGRDAQLAEAVAELMAEVKK